MPLTDLDKSFLREVDARERAATKGPWRYMTEDEQLTYLSVEHDGVKVWDIFGAIRGEENGEFCAHARTDIPRLREIIDRLQREASEHGAE